VDVFALGCLYYYCLTSGDHPYGDKYEREVNIIKDLKKLDGLSGLGEEGVEAAHLITQMLAPEPKERPDTVACLLHPFFWTPAQRLTFLQDASDRFEKMERDPPEARLVALETNAVSIIGPDWRKKLDKTFVDDLGKFRKYDGKYILDLLRALRNKKHHYQELPENVRKHVGPLPDGFLNYFTRRFPQLFLHVYGVVSTTSLHDEPEFRSYFELPDT
jgi:serine/threonine-protein kinase/endoribonuclease IRE1